MKTFQILYLILVILLSSCITSNSNDEDAFNSTLENKVMPKRYITVLGVAQDAGFPQINCDKQCCNDYYAGIQESKLVSCLGLVDRENNQKWLFDATPDIKHQIQFLKQNHLDNQSVVDGIFLTHAHIGHYTGLMELGREALGANKIPVYAMPKMKAFLKANGPWSQLVSLQNITLQSLKNDSVLKLNSSIKVTPFLVPHRDEFSETVGYKIEGKYKLALFIPDIDKWEKWQHDIIEEVKKVDYAFLDATFFSNGELERDMTEIPHPFITETTTLFENESIETKNKIHFIHFNHTNPALKQSHHLKDSISNLGFRFATQGDNFEL
ncbi:MBL fold metallo-hydrolase [Winogradskyella sp.]|uniref:MBL fold metallo-hydrolase n=1 Tax=Winogradskyella sp. TaxID=1883156 RepID=UPI003F6A7D21